MTDKVRVRFAPSPTGPLHIGGVRTALFNYLFARKHKGDFILRIEDTDQTRWVAGAEEYINESLEWLGILPDEGVEQGGNYGPYKQSDRVSIYRQYAERLIEIGRAYYAFDTPEELEILRKEYEDKNLTFSYDVSTRSNLQNSIALSKEEVQQKLHSGLPYVIRFKIPENETVEFRDLIRGKVGFDTKTLDDKVIFKADGLPTYHLANVVDDHLMNISHVIRGEEWLPSTPLHLLLYKALDWQNEMPEFAHLPLILKPSGKGKLSKRDGDKEGFPVFPLKWETEQGETSAGFREEGYFPEAAINFLAMLGWNPGNDQELFTLEQLINAFSLERVNKAGARFDPEKAKWYNQQYLQQYPNETIAALFKPMLEEKGIKVTDEFIIKVVAQVKERASFVRELWDQSYFYFNAPSGYDEKNRKKFWKEDTPALLEGCIKILNEAEPFTSALLEERIKEYITAKDLGFGKVMNPLRLAIVGAAKGPHLFDIFEMIGKSETLKRLKLALQKLG